MVRKSINQLRKKDVQMGKAPRKIKRFEMGRVTNNCPTFHYQMDIGTIKITCYV